MNRWRSVFGFVAIVVGVAFLYAAWAHPPLHGSTLCVPDGRGVHVEDWTLRYYSPCGASYPHQYLYLLGFTVVGFVLAAGGTATVREAGRHASGVSV